MTIYRISPEKAKVEKSQALLRFATTTSVAVLVGLVIGARATFAGSDRTLIISTILTTAVLLTFILWRGLKSTAKNLDRAYATFELSVDDKQITKRQADTTELTLARNEITAIEELKAKGFKILTANSSRLIWVPCEIENYDALKAEFLELPGIASRTQENAWTRSYLQLGIFLVLFAISFVATDKRIAAPLSAGLGVYLIAALRHARNPNLTTAGKRQLLLGGLVGVALLVRGFLVWRG